MFFCCCPYVDEPLLQDDFSNALSFLSLKPNDFYQKQHLATLSELTQKGKRECRAVAVIMNQVTHSPKPCSMELCQLLFIMMSSSDLEVQRLTSLSLSNLSQINENKPIIASHGLESILKFTETKNQEIQANIMGLITNLVTDMEIKTQVTVKTLKQILDLLKSELKVIQNSIGALVNLTHIQKNRVLLMELQCLKYIFPLFSNLDEETVFYATAVITNMAVEKDFIQDDFPIQILINNLHPPTSLRIQTQSLYALRNLASCSNFQNMIIESGALKVICSHSNSQFYPLLSGSIALFRNLSICSLLTPRLKQLNLFDSMVQNLLNLCLYEGIIHSATISQLMATENIEITMEMIDEVQINSISSLRNLASSFLESKRLIVQKSVLDYLCLCVKRHSSSVALFEVGATIAVLASDAFCRRKLLQNNVLSLVVFLSKSEHIQVVSNAVAAFANLATKPTLVQNLCVSQMQSGLEKLLKSIDWPLLNLGLRCLEILIQLQDVKIQKELKNYRPLIEDLETQDWNREVNNCLYSTKQQKDAKQQAKVLFLKIKELL